MRVCQYIAQRRGHLPVRQLCQVLRVSASAYYAWQRRQLPVPEPALQVAVRADFRWRFARYGAARTLGSTAPNQVWMGDITYLPKQGGGWLYLATWLDRYSRKVVGCDVRASMPEDLVSEALRRAFAVRQPAAGLIVHSDQGSQYSATNFKALVARHQAVQSMSRRGNCYDNAHAESFWSRFKTELPDGGSFRNLTEARLEISHYLAYYNAERRHSARGYLAPNHFEDHFQTMSHFCAA